VPLTDAGRLFLEHARRVLTELDGAVLAARRTIGGECDRLSVACTPWPFRTSFVASVNSILTSASNSRH
jgi:DNA-binding transcriptional LysR family regulator